MNPLRTPLDYQIAVRQGLQYLDSYLEDDVSEQEIDFNLNLQQERFIDHIFSNKFEDDQRRLDYVQNIIVKNKTLPALAFTTSDADYEANAQYSMLPPDYQHLINYRNTVWRDETNCDLTLLPAWNGTYTEYVGTLDFPFDTNTTSPYYQSVQMEFVEGGVTDRFGFDYDRAFSLDDSGEISPIVADIINYFSTQTSAEAGWAPNTFRFYWEEYRDISVRNAFIVVTDNVAFPSLTSMRINFRVSRPGGTTVNTNVTLSGSNYTQYSATGIGTALASNVRTGVIPSLDELYKRQGHNSFYKPTEDRPLLALSKGKLYLYSGKKSLITDTVIDYVRQPRQISLALNQSCELKDNAPQRIVDWTIERMKVVLENPAAQPLTAHNEIKVK